MNEETCSVCGQPDNCGDCTHVFVDNYDTRAFKAVFMDAEGEENLLLGYFDGPLEAFRFLQQFPMLGRVDWGFDGDCWYTDNTQTFTNAAGQVMVGSYSVHIR